MATSKVIGGDKVAARLRAAPVAIRGALAVALQRCALELLTRAKEKLGGSVLKVKTGRLRRSLNYKMTESGSGSVSATVGTNVIYAARHEYGFHGVENVRAHLRTIKSAFGKPIAPVTFTVPAHARQANTPERSFLRSSLRELQPGFMTRIEKVIKDTPK